MKFPRLVTPFGRVALSILVQPWKALMPIVVTDDGIGILFKLVHP